MCTEDEHSHYLFHPMELSKAWATIKISLKHQINLKQFELFNILQPTSSKQSQLSVWNYHHQSSHNTAHLCFWQASKDVNYPTIEAKMGNHYHSMSGPSDLAIIVWVLLAIFEGNYVPQIQNEECLHVCVCAFLIVDVDICFWHLCCSFMK